MDENLKKPKRPRIGEANLDENMENVRYEKVEYQAHEPNQGEENNPAAEGFQQQEDGYQPRQQGYHGQGGYQPVRAAISPVTRAATSPVTSSVRVVISPVTSSAISNPKLQVSKTLMPMATP